MNFFGTKRHRRLLGSVTTLALACTVGLRYVGDTETVARPLLGVNRVSAVAIVDDALTERTADTIEDPNEPESDKNVQYQLPPGTFRVAAIGGILRDPLSTSPANLSHVVSAQLLWESLTRTDGESEQPLPGLASRWSSNPALDVWTFTLSPKARFGSGTAITPADVVYTMRRAVEEGSGAVISHELRESLLRDREGNIRGNAVEAIDAKRVRFRLQRPDSEFALLLSNPQLGIVADGARTFDTDESTSGQFRVERRGGTVLLAANKTSLSRTHVLLRPYDSRERALQDFEDGRLDWTVVPDIDERGLGDRYGTRGDVESNTVLSLALNSRDPRLADRSVRAALFSAIDARSLVRDVFGTGADPALSLMPAKFSRELSMDPCLDGCRYDANAVPDEIRAMFAAQPLVIHVVDNAVWTSMASAVAQSLNRHGVRTEIRVVSVDEYVKVLADGDTEAMFTGAVATYPGARGFLDAPFASSTWATVTGADIAFVDSGLALARSERDPIARERLYRDTEAMLRQAALVLPLAELADRSVFSTTSDDVSMEPDGTLVFSERQ